MQHKKLYDMTFDKLLDNNTLWAVRYEGVADNAFRPLMLMVLWTFCQNYYKEKEVYMKKKTLEFLEAHQSETPSTWREEAEWRRDNWSWLQHSQKIAVKVLLQMKQVGLTQKALAERMNCTQQYVSKILKGKENMSLDTLTRLEIALGINLILDEQMPFPCVAAEEEVFA